VGKTRGRGKGKYEEDEKIIMELKAANRRLKSDNRKLKSEVASLQEMFSKTSIYLKNNTDSIPVEKIITGVNEGSTLQQIKDKSKCEKCSSTNVKELNVVNVGKILLCGDCKNRKVVKHGKDTEHEGQ